jgi:hypothetical protein
LRSNSLRSNSLPSNSLRSNSLRSNTVDQLILPFVPVQRYALSLPAKSFRVFRDLVWPYVLSEVPYMVYKFERPRNDWGTTEIGSVQVRDKWHTLKRWNRPIRCEAFHQQIVNWMVRMFRSTQSIRYNLSISWSRLNGYYVTIRSIQV